MTASLSKLGLVAAQVATEGLPLSAIGELLDTPQAAARIKIAPRTLEVWRATKRYAIPYIKVGGRVRYRVEDLDRWLASRVVSCEPR